VGGTFATLDFTNTPSYHDATVLNGTDYVYRIRALSEGGGSAYTTDLPATPTGPDPPTPNPGPSNPPTPAFEVAEYRPLRFETKVLRPHLRWPLRVVNGAYDVVEQDSPEEIRQCVEITCRTPRGSRMSLPDFGLPDQAFRMGGPSRAQIEAAIARWEPRAPVAIDVDFPDLVDDTLARVGVTVEAPR
jgi:hypothetical protein